MSEYEVTIGASIDFNPSTEEAEILQNVRTILATPRGSVPLDRACGVDTSLLDRPINEVQALLTADIISTIQRYEPRAEVTGVQWTGNGANGTLTPVVTVRIIGG